MKQLLVIIFTFGFANLLFSQENAPHIKGNVKISISEGTFDCDLTISNIPRIEDYVIRLNSGMNILNFQNVKPKQFVLYYDRADNDLTSTGESHAYYFLDNTRKGKFIPEEFRIRYVGKYPVANDTINNYSKGDWKGNIAFNGYSVRTDGSQTAWYPYLYDIKNDIKYSKVSYDLNIECTDGKTIYINGNKPVKSSKASLKSDKPYELALYCGKYNFIDDNIIVILNPKFTKEGINEFSKYICQFKEYYEQKLNIKFDQSPVFVNTTPTSKKNSWMYVCYPTIMGISWKNGGLGPLFNKETQVEYKQYIAHELGHYYFGTYKVFNSELGDMMSEGFSEYLSLKLVEDLQGREVYENELKEKIKQLEKFKPSPFSKIKSINDITNRQTYVYDYAPTIFLAIEKEIGINKMWEWINCILTTKTSRTNYQFMLSTLKTTLKDDNASQLIIREYFESDNSTDNALSKLKLK